MGNALSFAFGWAKTRGQVQIKKEHQGGRNHPGVTKEVMKIKPDTLHDVAVGRRFRQCP